MGRVIVGRVIVGRVNGNLWRVIVGRVIVGRVNVGMAIVAWEGDCGEGN